MAGVALPPHPDVGVGGAPATVEVRSVEVTPRGGQAEAATWANLANRRVEPGQVTLHVAIDGSGGGLSARVPVCAGRGEVRLDDRPVERRLGPMLVPLPSGPHVLAIDLRVSAYERRVACGEAVRVGPRVDVTDGLGVLSFPSPYGDRGGGEAVVYLPPGHDRARPATVLVGLHPWNGTPWTYAAYAELLAAARARDVVLFSPSGLGNSLYAADAEDEVHRAIDALREVLSVDPARVSLWGASMGGAGATTIGLHAPDRFASVTSFFGDAKYDLTTYVRGVLHDPRGAHAVDAVDVADNARWLPVWLVHGEADVTSPIRQSEVLDRALHQRGFDVRFDRAPGEGHSGALVARFLTAVVERAAVAHAPACPERVTYRGVRPYDAGAYGVRLERADPTSDAVVDLERGAAGVRVLRADNVRALVLDPACPIASSAVTDATGSGVRVRWAQRTP